MATEAEQVNEIWLSIYVPQESVPYAIELLHSAGIAIGVANDKIDALSYYLHSNGGLGDIRHDTGAIFTYLVTGDVGARVSDIRRYVAPDDDGNSVGQIRINTDNIPQLMSDGAALAVSVTELAAGIATAETGVGAAVAAVGAVGVTTDAIKLMADLIKTDTANDPHIFNATQNILSQLSDIADQVDNLQPMVAELLRVYQIITDTDWLGFTLALDKAGGINRPHLDLGDLGFLYLTDYLLALMRANPPAGYYEDSEAHSGAGVMVVNLTGAYAVRIVADDLPDWLHPQSTGPDRYRALGNISFGRMGGYHGLDPIRYINTCIQPLPAGTESIRVEWLPGVTGTVTRIDPVATGS